MNILITGASGQLGNQIRTIIERGESELGKIDSVYISSDINYVDSDKLNITDLNKVIKFVDKFKPSIVINCAAYTNVDKCETDIDNAFKVNAIGPRNLAIAVERVGAKLLQVSTDYVFDGKGKVDFKEFDMPHPVSIYGKTKLLGEQYVREFCKKYFIIRTSWLYGYYGKNFVYTIMKAMKERRHLDVVDDQIGNPTNAEDLAHHILKIVLTDEYGVYHCTGIGKCSWYDFASKIVEFSGENCIINPITSDKLKRIAKRPKYSSLDNMMLRNIIGDEMRQWQEALEQFIKTCQKQRMV